MGNKKKEKLVMAFLLIHLLIILSITILSGESAPVMCRSCTKNCFSSETNSTNNDGNSTKVDVDLLAELEINSVDHATGSDRRRSKREVEYRACARFQVEMLLIPTAIAMIPLVLCALFFCTCCCGPEESRGKLPEDFLSSLPMSKKRSVNEKLASEEIELEWGDGYVARKNSSKTKFSTTVSYIEARRQSIWSVTSVASDTAAETVKQEATKSLTNTKNAKLTKTQSCESIKRTRFSDTVSVISVDLLNRR